MRHSRRRRAEDAAQREPIGRAAGRGRPRFSAELIAVVLGLGAAGCASFDEEWQGPPIVLDDESPKPPAEPTPFVGGVCAPDDRLPSCPIAVTDGCVVEVEAVCQSGRVTCPAVNDSHRAQCGISVAPLNPPCEAGALDCQPPTLCVPRPERCNGSDDDCDGRVDEGFDVGGRCAVGEGRCARDGTRVCAVDGGVECLAAPQPIAADGQCDGLDDDCDGIVDEDPPCNGGPPGLVFTGPRFGEAPVDEAYWSHVGAATYVRGADDFDASDAEGPQHYVEIERPFLIGRYEVSIAQWQQVMGGNPAFHADCPTCPIERVSWYEALEFTNRLSASEGLSACYALQDCFYQRDIGGGCADDGEDRNCYGLYFCGGVEYDTACTGYRLPTEAEWETATRGGTTSIYWFGDEAASIREHENCNGPAGSETAAVTSGRANAFGVFNTLGNAAEWTFDIADFYDIGPGETVVDHPQDLATAWLGTGPDRIVRGGSPGARPLACRSSSRRGFEADIRYWYVGFRLARTVTDAIRGGGDD